MFRTLAAFALTFTIGLNTACAQNFFGTWRGVYQPSQMFTGSGTPYRSPPYDPINMELILHPFDTAAGRFGLINILSGSDEGRLFGGNVIELTQTPSTLALVTFVPEEGHPTGYADLSATLVGDRLQGTLNDRSPARFGWVHIRGTIDFARVVPEPSSAILSLAGFGSLIGYGLRLRMVRGRFRSVRER